MSEKLKQLYDIFKNAIEAEREAKRMYREAISLFADSNTIQNMEQYCRDEMRFEQSIIDQYMEQYNELKKELQITEH